MSANKFFLIFVLSSILFVNSVLSDCADETSEDGVGGFFHNLGCSVQRGAKKIGEEASKLGEKETWQKIGEGIEEGVKKIGDADTWKNLGEDISEGAKNLGENVKEKFSGLKDKLSGRSSSEEVLNDNINNNKSLLMEKIGSSSKFDNGDVNSKLAGMSMQNLFDFPNYQINENNNFNRTSSDSSILSLGNGTNTEQSSEGIDTRFITDTSKRCPDGTVIDERSRCRKVMRFNEN